FEPADGGVERMAAGDPRVPLLRAIRGVELRVADVRAKFKYGGNRPLAHRLNVAGRLAARDGPMDAQARAHLLRRSGEG
ncbi:MAG TPA: FMN-binding negative transcriptional regulator, partial [Candidatus Thermoplasmatota archaeon]|nr:FMN-binding negative transcriptional regulator [Candidatus Thermoplasmatota archaeon]